MKLQNSKLNLFHFFKQLNAIAVYAEAEKIHCSEHKAKTSQNPEP